MQKYTRTALLFSQQAKARLRAHHWPGHVRELDHAVQRGVLMERETEIAPQDLGLAGSVSTPRLEDLTLAQAERHLIDHALKTSASNIQQAAKRLRLSSSALYRRLEKFAIAYDRSLS